MKIVVAFCFAIAGVLSAPPTYNYNAAQQSYNNKYNQNQNVGVPKLNKYNQNVPLQSNKYNQNVALPTLHNKYNEKFPIVTTYNRYKDSDKSQDQEATIISYKSTNDGLGNYEFEYETSDGQIRKERGELIQVAGAEEPIIKVTGSYTYRDPENKSHTINYIADADGYRSMEESTRRKIVPQLVSQSFSSPSQSLGILGSISKTFG